MTMTLVSTITVTSPGGAASIEFTGIPQTGTDLLLVLSGRTTGGLVFDAIDIGVNSSTVTSYSSRLLRGSGSATVSQTNNRWFTGGDGATSNTFGSMQLYIPNYTSTSAKSYSVESVTENNATEAYQHLYAGLWSGVTSAITSLALFSNSGSATWKQYSTASLYTITKGSGGASVS